MSQSEAKLSPAKSALKQGQDAHFAEPPDYVLAEQLFRKAIELEPQYGEGYHWLSAALEQQGKLAEACEAARSAVRLLPGDPRPLIALGYCLSLSGKHAEAVSFLEQGLSLKPHYAEADALNMLAEAYENLGQIDKAATLWRQVLKMTPFYPSEDTPMKEAAEKLAKHGLKE